MANTYTVQHQFTADTGPAYSIGDVLEGIITLAALGKAGGALHSLSLFNRQALTPTINLHLFRTSPTAGTITDNAAFVIADADDTIFIATIQVSNWLDIAAKKVAVHGNLGIALPQTKSGDIFLVPELRSSFEPTDADALRLILGIRPG